MGQSAELPQQPKCTLRRVVGITATKKRVVGNREPNREYLVVCRERYLGVLVHILGFSHLS